jgi:hypothetical protein
MEPALSKMNMIQYKGSPEAVCPITLTPFKDIVCPFAFRTSPHQPYEATALAKWLSVRRTNPLTNMPCTWNESPFEILAPLTDCQEGAAAAMQSFLQHLQKTSGGSVFDQVLIKFAQICPE